MRKQSDAPRSVGLYRSRTMMRKLKHVMASKKRIARAPTPDADGVAVSDQLLSLYSSTYIRAVPQTLADCLLQVMRYLTSSFSFDSHVEFHIRRSRRRCRTLSPQTRRQKIERVLATSSSTCVPAVSTSSSASAAAPAALRRPPLVCTHPSSQSPAQRRGGVLQPICTLVSVSCRMYSVVHMLFRVFYFFLLREDWTSDMRVRLVLLPPRSSSTSPHPSHLGGYDVVPLLQPTRKMVGHHHYYYSCHYKKNA